MLILLNLYFTINMVLVYNIDKEKQRRHDSISKLTLKAARVNAGLKQKEVAKTLGISTVTLNKWEGGTSEPKVSQAITIAKLYGVNLEDIFFN